MPENDGRRRSSAETSENRLKRMRALLLQRAASTKRSTRKKPSRRRRKPGEPPRSPPPIDFSKYTEEEISIISSAFEKQLTFDRELFRLQRGLQEASQEIERQGSPEPQDSSEVCRMCNRVRMCGEILSINRKKYHWLCESCQLRYSEHLKSGGWFHGCDAAFFIDYTAKLLDKCKRVQHMGISNDLREMVYHQTRVGTIKIRLLYDEPMKMLMVGAICADELDVDLHKVDDRTVFVEAYVSPRIWSKRLTKVSWRNITVKPRWEQLFFWKDIQSTELPLGTVPLNDIGFWLQLFPGEGKEVYKPKDVPKPVQQEMLTKSESDDEFSFGGKNKKKVKPLPGHEQSPPKPCSSAGERDEKRKKKQLKLNADNLKWTLQVLKQVVDRQREEEKKAAMLKMEELKKKQEPAEHQKRSVGAKKKKADAPAKTVGIGKLKVQLPFASSDSDKDENDGGGEEGSQEGEDNKRRKVQEEEDNLPKGPLLLELASQHKEEISPLDNEIDYRLDNETNVEYWRERLMKLVDTQLEEVSTALPLKVHALRVQAPRLRSKDLYFETVITERQDLLPCESDDEEEDEEEGEVLLTEDNDGVTGPAQVRKKKHKGAIPNGEVLIILQKRKDESMMLIIKEARNIWNFHPSDLNVYFALVKDKRHFLRQKRHGIKGAETFPINLSRVIHHSSTLAGTHFQITFTQKDPRYFLKSVPVITGEVIINMDKLPIPKPGYEIEHWYPLIPSRKVRIIAKGKKTPATLGKVAGHAASLSAMTLPLPERSAVQKAALDTEGGKKKKKKKKTAAEKSKTLPVQKSAVGVVEDHPEEAEDVPVSASAQKGIATVAMSAANIAMVASRTTPLMQSRHHSSLHEIRPDKLAPQEDEWLKKSRSLGPNESLVSARRSVSMRELIEGRSNDGRDYS